MIVYDRSADHDALLAQWWARLWDAHEFERAFDDALVPLGAFLGHWRTGPRTLWMWVDVQGVWMAVWFEPVFSGAFMGLWIRRDYRRGGCGRQSLAGIHAAHRWAFSRWPVVLVVTKQEQLLRPLRKLGYTEGMVIPRLWNGCDTWVLTTTEKTYVSGE